MSAERLENQLPRSYQDTFYTGHSLFGFTQVDGTLPFLLRLHALLPPDATVLEYGAGRGAQFENATGVKRHLLDWRKHAERVIGVDVSDAVFKNPVLTEAMLLEPCGRIPLPDETADLVVADWVCEHLERPDRAVEEIHRVLKPGGWFGFRTPNRYHYSMLAAQAVPAAAHVTILRRVQAGRQDEDVFPKWYRMNTLRSCRRTLGGVGFQRICVLTHEPEPTYLNFSLWAYAVGVLYQRVVTTLPMRTLRLIIMGFAMKPCTPLH